MSSNKGGGLCCVRSSLIIFNFITLLAGLATLGIGLWFFMLDPVEDLAGVEFPTSADFKFLSIFFLGLGSLVSFVSVIGCAGSCFKSRCLLLSYLATVILILTLQLLLAASAFIYREPLGATLREELLRNLREDYSLSLDSTNSIRRNLDVMQIKFECCGVDGYKDWYKAKAWPGKDYVPDSCCKKINGTLIPNDCGKTGNVLSWNQGGCMYQIQDFILEQLHVLASVLITLIFLQLYGIIASTLLFFHAKTPKKPKSPQYKAYLYERARM